MQCLSCFLNEIFWDRLRGKYILLICKFHVTQKNILKFNILNFLCKIYDVNTKFLPFMLREKH